MNQTVQFVSPTFPASFMVDEAVVKDLFAKAKESVDSGKTKTASEYVNRLVRWAVDNYEDNAKNYKE
jgi:hypothetical protein